VYVGLNCLENLCLSLVSGVPHFFFRTTPLHEKRAPCISMDEDRSTRRGDSSSDLGVVRVRLRRAAFDASDVDAAGIRRSTKADIAQGARDAAAPWR